jgi:hypothetical protein
MERQWYSFVFEGIEYEVLASSPDAARENFLLWNRHPVEVDWIVVRGFVDNPLEIYG